MHEQKDCGCRNHHHRGHHHKYSTLIKRTGETIEIPAELLEVAEIKEGDFLQLSVHKVLKPSERKEHYIKHHKKHHHD